MVPFPEPAVHEVLKPSTVGELVEREVAWEGAVQDEAVPITWKSSNLKKFAELLFATTENLILKLLAPFAPAGKETLCAVHDVFNVTVPAETKPEPAS